MQTRYTSLENPEKLRPYIDEFLERAFLTDSVLLYAPSQVALAATLHAASKASASLDNYVTDILFSREQLGGIIEAVRSKYNLYIIWIWIFFYDISYLYLKIHTEMRSMAKSVEPPSRDLIRALEKKLDKCRNQENNPDSDM